MQVEHYSFGRIRIDGKEYLEDVLIVGDVVHSPWWRDAGGHVFAPQDLKTLIEAAPEVVYLGTGCHGRVGVRNETLEAFAAAGTRVVQDRTGRVVEELNRLALEGRRVAAALHLTC